MSLSLACACDSPCGCAPITISDINSDTQAKHLIRFGWWVKNSSGASLSLARVSGVVEIIECQ